jgi:hypothetical protein
MIPVLSEAIEYQKIKRERENENNKLYLPPLSLKINNTYSKDTTDEDIYNKSLKSMLNDIQAINSDISFKLNIIEQQSNNIKNKNRNQNNIVNNNQINTISTIKTNINHFAIPNNNSFKNKNIIGNLFKKDTDKTIQQNLRLTNNKTKNFRIYSSTKKLKNVPSAGNIKPINNVENNISKNINYNINKENKNFVTNSPWNVRNIPAIDIKNNKIDNRNKSSLNRNVKNLPKSAKSRGDSKNTKKDESNEKKNKNNENKKNINQEKTIRMNEIFNKEKEDNNESIINENKNEKYNYMNNKRKNKFQNSDIDINNINKNRKSNSFGNDTGNTKENKSNQKEKKETTYYGINQEKNISKEKINKPSTPYYRMNKEKKRISQDIN